MTFKLSKHARVRMQQRGLKPEDVRFIFENGTEIDQGILLTERDALELEAFGRYIMHSAQRLRGFFIPIVGEVGKTVFHASQRQQSRML